MVEPQFSLHYISLGAGVQEAHLLPKGNPQHMLEPNCWCRPHEADIPPEERVRLAEAGVMIWVHHYYSPKGENGHGL